MENTSDVHDSSEKMIAKIYGEELRVSEKRLTSDPVQFINLLTDDENIRVGHDLESSTLDVSTSLYVDQEAGHLVTLVDTPGFDDSRKGVTDTDILGKIAAYLQDAGGRRLNGLIYLHRISDPRMSGTAKKNLKMFTELCGANNFEHVFIVTTYWNRVGEGEGVQREEALAKGPFKNLIDGGAKMFRQDKNLESARSIISELSRKSSMTLRIQEELNAGRALGETSAGAVIVEEIKELQKKHTEEMESLRKEMEEAVNAADDDLRAELATEYQKLEEAMALANHDQQVLTTARDIQSREEAEANMQRAFGEFVEMPISQPEIVPAVEAENTARPEPNGQMKNARFHNRHDHAQQQHKLTDYLQLPTSLSYILNRCDEIKRRLLGGRRRT